MTDIAAGARTRCSSASALRKGMLSSAALQRGCSSRSHTCASRRISLRRPPASHSLRRRSRMLMRSPRACWTATAYANPASYRRPLSP